MPCAGDSGEICGGGNALSIYKNCNGGSCSNAQYGVVGNTTTTSYAAKAKRHIHEHIAYVNGLSHSH